MLNYVYNTIYFIKKKYKIVSGPSPINTGVKQLLNTELVVLEEAMELTHLSEKF